MPTHTACPPPPPPDFESSSRGPRVTQSMGYPPPPEPLRCPRCDSDNTKFCYYNNYNMAQPRHHCKSCRRYWTHGGSLRDIPVGGGTRRNYTTKNNNNSNSDKKKPKLSHHQHHPASGSVESSSTASLPSSSVTHDTTAGPTKEVEKSVLTSQQLVNLDRSIAAATNVGFSSLMMMTDNSSSQVDPTSGFLSLGYGPGPVHGFLQGFGYGASRAALVWDFPVGGVSFADLNDNSVRPAAAVCSGFDTWRVGGDREVVRGDWPETVVEEKVADSSSTELPCLNFPPF